MGRPAVWMKESVTPTGPRSPGRRRPRGMRISHEAIYQALFVQSRGTLQRELVACLRTGRVLRVPQSRARQRAGGHVTPEVMTSNPIGAHT